MDVIDTVREANKTPLGEGDETNDELRGTSRSSNLEVGSNTLIRRDHLENFSILTPIPEDIDNEPKDWRLLLEHKEIKHSPDINLDISHSPEEIVHENDEIHQRNKFRKSLTPKFVEKLNEKEIDQISRKDYSDQQITNHGGEEFSTDIKTALTDIKNQDKSDKNNNNSTLLCYSEDNRSDSENKGQDEQSSKNLRNKEYELLKESNLKQLSDNIDLGSNGSLLDTENTNESSKEGREAQGVKQSVYSLESIGGDGGSESGHTLQGSYDQQQERMSSEEKDEGGDSPRGDNQLFHMLLDEYEDDFDDESTSNMSISVASDDQRGHNNEQNFEKGQRRGQMKKLTRTNAIDEGDEDETGGGVDVRERSELTDEEMADRLVKKDANKNAGEVENGREFGNSSDDIRIQHETEINNPSTKKSEKEVNTPLRDNEGNLKFVKENGAADDASILFGTNVSDSITSGSEVPLLAEITNNNTGTIVDGGRVTKNDPHHRSDVPVYETKNTTVENLDISENANARSAEVNTENQTKEEERNFAILKEDKKTQPMPSSRTSDELLSEPEKNSVYTKPTSSSDSVSNGNLQSSGKEMRNGDKRTVCETKVHTGKDGGKGKTREMASSKMEESTSEGNVDIAGFPEASDIDAVEGINMQRSETEKLDTTESDAVKLEDHAHKMKGREGRAKQNVMIRNKDPRIARNGQHVNNKNTNRHEGHNCPRELRRLDRLKERETAGNNNEVTIQQEVQHRGTKDSNQTKETTFADGRVDDANSTFPGSRSEEAASSSLIETLPAGKNRRKKKSSDPFAGLPTIIPWHIHQQEQNSIKEKPKRRNRNEKRFRVSQFDDPFNQMVWMLFRTADKDGNNKLNKKELSLILQSPNLELSLTNADVKNLLLDCSKDENIDLKTCELCYEEFVPLGRLLLMVYYSKLDESSQSKWCVLDKGNDNGLIYFNKLTGDASTSIPSDYYGDVLHEPDLLELSIHDLFEDADINDDGKINVNDFLMILRSEDFGLFLTNTDAEEIMQYFINTRGREIMVEFDEFVPLAKRMILTVYKARDPSMHEWCHLYTKNVGSFWFNKRTGQADRHPPTSLVRTQQDMLEHRSREIEVFMQVAEDLHFTKEELERETRARQELENQLAELKKEHEATTKELAKTTKNFEKSSEEVDKKSKQILIFEKERVKQQHLINNLQDRAEEADRIDANMESLRNLLQTTQTTVREKEFEVRDLSRNLEETSEKLSNSQELAANLQDKIDDLVVQIRDEIRRNERIDKEVERTKSYKSEKVEIEDILKETKDELQMRINQLTHARYEIRDSKSRIRKLETEFNSYPDLQAQLAEKETEISLLKEDMQRLESHMMDDVRRTARQPRPAVKRYSWNKVRNIESSDKTHDCSDPFCPINGKNSCSAESNQLWAFKKSDKTQNHPNGKFLELLNNVEDAEEIDGDDELNIYDWYEPQYPVGSPRPVRASPASGDKSRPMRPKSSAGRIETKRPKGVLLYEEDYLLARFVKEGDRIRIKKHGVQILGMKPSDLRTATVRYVGQLDQDGGEHMLFVGLHMDDAVGNTNGILEGKRYFYTKRKHGKMVRITEVLYLYNTKTTSFDKLSELVEEYKASRRKPWYQSSDEGPRLIKVT